MSDRPLVSVVIATHNMADYLQLAVQSALDQTYQNVEILIVDDGSTDGTRLAVEPYLADGRVKYLRQSNQGQAAAKNHGVRAATGEYVAFLDADDLWLPDKLEAQIPLFSRSRTVGVVYAGFTFVDQDGRQLHDAPHKLYRGRVTGPMLIFNFVGFGTSVVRRECFSRLGLFREDLGMGIDYDLWLRFSTQYEFDFVNRPLLHYRTWPGQMSGNWRKRYLNGIGIMKNFLQEHPDAVDRRTVDEAWASTFSGFGYYVRTREAGRREALSLYLRALRHKPGYLPAWKGIAATLLGR